MEGRRVAKRSSSHNNEQKYKKKIKSTRFIPPKKREEGREISDGHLTNSPRHSPLLLTYSASQLDDSLEEECISQSLCGNSQEEEGDESEKESESEEEEESQPVTTTNTRWAHNSTHPLLNIAYKYNGKNYVMKQNPSHKNDKKQTDITIKTPPPLLETSNVFDFPISQVNEKKSDDKTVDRSVSSDHGINDSVSHLNQSISNRSIDEQRAINAEVLRQVREIKAEIEERKQHYAKLIAAARAKEASGKSILEKSLTQQELSFFLSGSEE